MTRKRYKKLLMARGISRNEADACAREIVEDGDSYQADYDRMLAIETWMPGGNYAEMAESVRRACDAIAEAAPGIIEAIARVAEAFVAGVNAFSEVFREKMEGSV